MGDKTTYNDRTADPAVPNYTYKIQAVNASGEGFSATSSPCLLASASRRTGSCSAPGVTVITDPVGDETDGVTEHDITSISMAEPISNPQTGAADNLIFTIKVQDLTTVPPGWRWSVRFTVAGLQSARRPDRWGAGRLVRLDAFIR